MIISVILTLIQLHKPNNNIPSQNGPQIHIRNSEPPLRGALFPTAIFPTLIFLTEIVPTLIFLTLPTLIFLISFLTAIAPTLIFLTAIVPTLTFLTAIVPTTLTFLISFLLTVVIVSKLIILTAIESG